MLDPVMTSPWAKKISLLLLRVTTGFLLIWFGLNKIVKGSVPGFLKSSVENEPFLQNIASFIYGGGEALIGFLCVIGLLRVIVLPLQAIINGSTALKVWWAILDPFRWYIEGVDRIVFNSHVFYPTAITFAACILLIVFRHEDSIAADHLIKKMPRE